ncbi:TIGR04423 family type III CRISPR-associated protein [uncultured Campylobacter sp.]|mgnify:FL=1|uniref:TIGR04423 family type III CRISPR-associated protein n=1 Tax=uncultured Campylobacter sp. TaxID=218934 RepID=UPI00263850F4|nr:TIGR04423 family type III CRISPR-associated protein [uncultured Campylobacter sp.]
MKKNKDEILKYMNENLKGYEGYIQLMGEKIDEKHLFLAGERTPGLGEDELIYEAHFFDEKSKKSVSIRQINDAWFVDETELNKVALEESDIKTFYPKFGNFKIKMAQIWQDEKDEFCEVPQDNGTLEGLPVLKLQKIVFAGFVKDEKDKK